MLNSSLGDAAHLGEIQKAEHMEAQSHISELLHVMFS